MGVVAALGLVAGIVLVVVAWMKRGEKWAPFVFWVGVVLLLLPIVWEFGAGFFHGVREAPR